jgi:hypothetical protein
MWSTKEALLQYPERTLRDWRQKRPALLKETARGAKNIRGAGRPPVLPFAEELLAFMKSVRSRNKCMSIMHMVEWIKSNQPAWLDQYLRTHPARGASSLHDLCYVLAVRGGYTYRRTTKSKLTAEQLQHHKEAFAAQFWGKYFGHDPADIINIDETAVYFDAPPRHTYTQHGTSAAIEETDKNSGRLTAVLACRQNGVIYCILSPVCTVL